MTNRFFYNPDNDKLQIFDNGHVEFFHNRKNEFSENFDYYIRGIITEENKILLRVFYPYSDIEDLSFAELLDKSRQLLDLNLQGIKEALRGQGVTIEGIIYNVTNEEAKTLLKTCYV